MYGLNDIMNSKGIHITHLNIRSLMNKWETFKIQLGNSNFHILGISITWLNDMIPTNLITLSSDYTFYRNDRKWTDLNLNTPKKGGGVGLFINSKLNSCGDALARMNICSKNLESQWVIIKQPHCKQIVIGNIYRPPQGNIDSFIEILEENVGNIDLTKVELFLTGDFNIDWSEKDNPNFFKLLELTKSLGLRQLIRDVTRPTLNTNSCIDLILTN